MIKKAMLLLLFLLSLLNYACIQQTSQENTIEISDSVILDPIVGKSDTSTTDADTVYGVEYVLDSNAVGVNFEAKGNYNSILQKIRNKRVELALIYSEQKDSVEKKAFLDSVSLYLTNILLNEIFPHWYGTAWDFNGISNIPGEGEIACGYFISTTLKHIGFNMNRYKFAQQSGLNGAKTLQMGKPIKYFMSENGDPITKQLIHDLEPGLYQVGLDFHVGFLLINNQNAYFIHSNYIETGVMLEEADFSEAFQSDLYVISDIQHNTPLIEKWLLDERIIVITE